MRTVSPSIRRPHQQAPRDEGDFVVCRTADRIREACIGDKAVDPIPFCENTLGHCFGGGFGRDVGIDEDGVGALAAKIGGGGGAGFCIDFRNRDPRPFRSKPLGISAAKAPPGSSDDDDFVLVCAHASVGAFYDRSFP